MSEDVRYATDPDGILWKAVLTELGEGWNGEYNPDDPEDEELVRFDMYRERNEKDWWDADHGEHVNGRFVSWYAPQDSSYCTALPVGDKAGRSALLAMLTQMVETGDTGKRDWEQASWFGHSRT